MNPLEILDVLSRIGIIGVGAILIGLILSGRLVTKGHVDDIRNQLDKAHEALHETLRRIEDGVNALRDRRRDE
jgi:hypothetical protein